MNLTRGFRKSHLYSCCPAVPNGIVERFLQNAKEAKADFERNSSGHVVPEIDVYPLPLGEFHTPVFYASDDTQISELGRVQLVRQTLHVLAHIDCLQAERFKAAANVRRIFPQLLKLHCQ